MKRILSIALACVMLFTSLSFAKENEEKPMKYEVRFATVTEVPEGDYEGILVENDMDKGDMGEKEMFLYVKTKVVDLKTGEFVEGYKFKKGEKIQYFYRADTPMMLSLPAQMTPDVIGVNVDESKFSIDVDYFDKDGHGIGNRLDLNLGEDGKAKNFAGEEVKDFLPNELLVLYTIATRSLPPIAAPEKIEILQAKGITDEADDSKETDKEDILKAYEKTADLYYMRKALEGLGAEVNWIRDTNTTEITKADKKVIIYNENKEMRIDDMVIEMTDFNIEDKTSFIGREDLVKILDYLGIKY
ncbi:stalk domain-containing protein [Ezakiella peruensis]|uniref:stalk domain-containing protein n=1 Tax=Ezakiella peruensis TaxID=1464038 RepID=UPI000C1B0FCA|nr:stalk domain-containing protein [Ezakiella peruensis]